MISPKPNAAATMALALLTGGCDRLPSGWASHAEPTSITVKLPPAKAAAPGFNFESSHSQVQEGASLNRV